MARYLPLVLLALLSFFPHARAEAGEPLIAFADGADRAEIDYRSQGCFHSVDAKLVVHRNPPHARVVTPSGSHSLALSAADLAGLDRLFSAYRSDLGEGCTTQDTIRVSWFRDETHLASEEFEDSSCRSPLGAVSLAELVRRARID